MLSFECGQGKPIASDSPPSRVIHPAACLLTLREPWQELASADKGYTLLRLQNKVSRESGGLALPSPQQEQAGVRRLGEVERMKAQNGY